MPEGMQAIERELPLFTLPFEPGVRSVVVHRTAVPGCEQSLGGMPLITDALDISVALGFVQLYKLDHLAWYRNGALGFFRLGRVCVHTFLHRIV